MKRRIKKAFTLVELLVVIAILAILSTVAIVGYNSFIEKANISVDEQAVTQMNKVLQAREVNDGKANSPMEAAEILVENGYNGDFSTYHSDYELLWLREANRMVLVEDNKVVYPKEYEGITYSETNTYHVLADLPHAGTVVWPESELRVEAQNEYNGSSFSSATYELDLDAAMNFSTSDTAETIKGKFYKDYIVDFVIRTNQDIDFTGYLWGYYESWGLAVSIPVSALTIEANTTNNVMRSVGMFLTYDDVVNNVISFDCGIQVSDDTKVKYPNLEITLELWMYEGVDNNGNYTGSSYLIGTPYTFAIN